MPTDHTSTPDPILEAIHNAPLGDPFTAEEHMELDQAVEDIVTGRVVPIRHEDVPSVVRIYRAQKQK